ncbi:MAG: aldehyde dehydrogenase family protein [Sutterella sp.]|nr:aldehyde dehydrogenase family protein [Sutterella sp.]
MELIDKKYGLFINGEWVDAEGGKTFETFNPATGEKLADCADASPADIDRAVAAARAAFPAWSKTSPEQRANLLLKIADLVEANLDRLAKIETMDNGKPIRETTLVDLPLTVDHFRYFAGALRAEEGSATMIDENTLSIVLHEPIGVVGQIIPWNFPILMAAWKLAPALAAGNTVVIKSSSATPLSLNELVKLMAQVLPPGVVNVITGRGAVSGQAMLDNPGFDKLAFTGSTDVGYSVAEAAAKRLIPATLELGGKSANIVFDDAQLDKAIEGAQIGILFNQGQVCCAGSRIFVQEGIYDEFVKKLGEAFEKVVVGDPLDMKTQVGSQVNVRQLNKIMSYVEVAKQEGASIVAGGKPASDKGAFMRPTLIADANNQMRVAQEEIFGPVAVVIKFKTEEDAIKMANDSEYGLGGAVWTRDINRAFRVANAVRTGRMWVNTYNELPAHAPFGGYKKSGIGRETHKMMLAHYSQAKNIYISLSEAKRGFF